MAALNNVTIASKGGNADYTGALNGSVFFTKGYNGDDTIASATDLGTVTGPGGSITDWVGQGDEYDYGKFTLESGAKLSITITSTDAAKFTIWQLDGGKMKSLQSTAIGAGKTVDTKELLLNAGDYYVSIQSTNASKGGDAYYTGTLNGKSVFFTDGYNGDDTIASAAELGIVDGPGGSITDWVGLGDEYDYGEFTLESGAKLSFTVTSTDAAKFTIWQQDGGKLKSLQSTAIGAGKTVDTKELLLNAGDYYVSMQSTNASKGGNADYTGTLNTKSAFFTNGYNGDDTIASAADLGTVDGPGALDADWVGLGDEYDYRKFTLDSGAKLSFTVTSTDAVKFTIWQQDGSKLKSLQSITVGAGKTADTKELLLNAGKYYYSVQSTNASKGGSADYTVSVNGKSAFFTNGYNGDDTIASAADLGTVTEPGGSITDWVGLGDEYDYGKFTLDSGAKLSFTVTSTDAAKFTIWQQDGGKLKSLQSITVGAGKTVDTKELLLNAGDYYVSMQSTNASKGGDAYYTGTLNGKSVFFTNGYNGDDTIDSAADLGTVTEPGALDADWVGLGDEYDYRKFTLDSGAKLSFTITSTDAAKFTIWQQDGGKLKSLQSTAIGAGKTVDTKELLLSSGEYYYSVQSTNASKGGSADYTVSVNGKSAFFTNGYNGDDTIASAADLGTVTEPGGSI
ncbi:MAG: hypothetical protein E7055_13615, partial [Lentisphaerae bacterium]|nr:hypothetical protein [Lentisphaerota bacterium]